MSVKPKVKPIPKGVLVLYASEVWLTNEYQEPYYGVYFYWLHPVNRKCDRVLASMYDIKPASPAAEVLFYDT